MTRIVLVVALGLSVGCKIKNEESCQLPENANSPACSDTPPTDGAMTCSDDPDCTEPGLTFCKLPEGVCVGCLASTDCAGVTPVCGATGSCQACVAHSECASDVCLPTGDCADPLLVAYIEAGSSGDCSQASPCVDPNTAIATSKPIFKITGSIIVSQLQTLNRTVTIFADPDAKITRTGAGSILSAVGGANVTIFDLEISGALVGGDGISMSGMNTQLTLERVLLRGNDGAGVVANNTSNTGKLTIRRSILVNNDGGGVNVSGVRIDMTNNLFVKNGSAVPSGGAVLSPLGSSNFEFNTVADNVSTATNADGVGCNAPFAAANNIVVGNTLGSQCAFTFTMYDGETSPAPSGAGNFMGDASFENTDESTPRDPGFYRISVTSDAIDKANTTSTINIDIDGQTRAADRDVGADERP